jgi:hypothetical protein
MKSLILRTLALLLLAAGPASAQMSTLVVPPGEGVVAIPPRGALPPPRSAAPARPMATSPAALRPAPPRRVPEPREQAFDAGLSPAAAALALLPLAAAAALATTLPGGGGGGSSGPARTR